MLVINKNNILGLLRIALAFEFLWAFFDKLLGLGYATCRNAETLNIDLLCQDAWAMGGKATLNFLKFGAYGPFSSFYHNIAGTPLVEWLFMLGLLGIGLALFLGVGVRLAGFFGAILMLAMYSAVFPPKNNPLVDEHLIYALLCVMFMYSNAGKYLGLSDRWQNLKIVKKIPILK